MPLSSGSAVSSTARSRNGEIIPSPAENTISAITAAEPHLVGREQRDDPVGVALALGVEQRRLIAPAGPLAAHPVAARCGAHPV